MHAAVEVEVFRHRITAVAEAMGAALQLSASSPNIKERLDFSCAIFDSDGRMLAQAAHIPVHLGAMPAAVAAARRQVREWPPGDVIVLNDPSLGGSHLPDITTISRVSVPCASRELRLFTVTRAHHADVGGSAPGSMGLVGDLYGEGLIIPPVRLVRNGVASTDVMDIVCANSRTGAERRGDLEAQLAAHRVGEQRLLEWLGTSSARFAAAAQSLLDYSERRARAMLARIPPGTYVFRDVLESDGLAATDLEIAVAVTLDHRGIAVDFTGTAPQTPGGVNVPLAVTYSAVYYVVAGLLGDTPLNAGAFRAVRVRAPLGSLVHARPGAAVAAGNVETSQRIVDAVLGALSSAAPDRVPAASQGTMNNVLVGGVDPRTNRAFAYYETTAGGAGGGPTALGASAVQVHMTNTRNTPVEALETAYPIRVETTRVLSGSGGDGQHRGGDGVLRRLRFMTPATVTVIGERRRVPPWGLAGGSAGTPGAWALETTSGRRELPAKCTVAVSAGDVLELRTPGGGGWGLARPTSLEEGKDPGQHVEDDDQG